MRKTILFMLLLLCGTCPIRAQFSGVSAGNVRIDHEGNYMSVDMTLDLYRLKVSKNSAVLLTPRLASAQDSVDMTSVGIYGRRRYYYYVRNGESMLTGKEEKTYRASKVPDTLAYHYILPYAEWMDASNLKLHCETYGCCGTLLDEQDIPLGGYKVFRPILVYSRPTPEKDARSLSGSALVCFPVNKTAIYPDYLNNPRELARICATIDSVREDPDITITSVWLKGYASPEGSYAHNRDLAKGRTEAVKNYIQNLYKFDDGVIRSDFEAENWSDLRGYVGNSILEHRAEILAMIDDNSTDPDVKEARIKNTYPMEYKYLLDNCYPALRHTDYKVDYVIRAFTDVEEIKRVFGSNPSKLSLNELYLLAQEYEAGTDEYSGIFETAVRMYPDSDTAKLNAANSAIARGDLETAKRYLSDAGESGEADYARGVVAVMEGDKAAALPLFESAKSKGISEADYCIDYIK